MTSPSTIYTNTQPIVGANGDVYTAPVGTPPPTIEQWETDPNGVIPGWTKMGMVSEDGVTWTPPEEDTTDIYIWQSKFPARNVTTSMTSSLGFALDGWDRETIPFAMGGGEFVTTGETVIFHPPKPGDSVSKAIFVKVLDGEVKLGVYFPKGRVSGRDDTVFKRDEAALLNVTFSLEGSTEHEPYQLIFDKATFPDAPVTAVPATGATAGEPGTWTPSGSTPPATLVALQTASPAVAATPTTAWTTGQHVLLSDGVTDVFWDSDSWEDGMAP